ncbi:MAG: fibrillarin-like rRNA/tRNA 2'-O-methyltransferase [Candidatus Lokiarchaeota archaeon]|nr:fibrillarin-like rRNA/tRNA 2'-O-methyltransferase [Candidatus Lokiarchaeota archaeon]
MAKIKKHPKFDGIYYSYRGNTQAFYTKNLDVGNTIYGERTQYYKGKELRKWDPNRSKLCAALTKNARNIYFTKNSNCLYLGASSGTTVSHISDILTEGIIYAVEFAPRSIRELVQNTENRKNIIPILADAKKPVEYARYIVGAVDIVYEDVAQPDLTEIGIANCKKFLTSGGIFIMAIKARSIDVVSSPKDIYVQEIDKLKEENFEILEEINLSPYSQDHLVVISRYFENTGEYNK